jgi:SPP1 gp7 family putative phage head morphogenesis protein
MNPLDQRALADLYTRNLNQIENINQNVKNQLLIMIESSIRQHEGIDKIARDIKNKIPEITAPRAKVIARTELAHAYNVAISNSYQSAGIKQWQWLSALAETTCQDCQNLHGQVFDFGEPEPHLHPNCLCTEYPIVLEPFEVKY